VLARKYRPAHFGDLIGQERDGPHPDQRLQTGRIPQAWMLTGVRGVGKTTTARILARALNYERPMDGRRADHRPARFGIHCQAIMEGRHIDVIEMDAASNNGVDDVRQINDAVRYAPVSARYKVYIIDEVHMLSTVGLQRLPEDAGRAAAARKFIFATTEIRKVPVTVLSRCQRFDLRRVDAGLLVAHLSASARRKGTSRSRRGAGRDRARRRRLGARFALDPRSGDRPCGRHGRARRVRSMLGLADRARVIDLFEAC
jgi:DNA polymerase-3 subunit gamma/tau